MLDNETPDCRPAPMPVTLLTGFLGSGKTTVLNRLLRDPAFAHTAVIVNEFGEIGLDHELIVTSTESMVLLQSGCLCCSLRGDLVETLCDMSERRLSGELDFERVVIETTGLADPAPIVHTLMTSRDLDGRFQMDGIVTTVDAVNGPATLQTYEEARRQVALAERILLTKTDLPEAQTVAVRKAIVELNPAAPLEPVLNGAVDPETLQNLGHFDPEMTQSQVQGWLRLENVPRPGIVDLAALRHLDAIRSVSWVIDRPITAATFDLWTDMMMAKRGADILRFKALIHVEGAPVPFVIHGVQHIFHPPVALKDWQGTDHRSKFVMIVRDFTDPEIREMFETLETFRVTEHRLPVGYLSEELAP